MVVPGLISFLSYCGVTDSHGFEELVGSGVQEHHTLVCDSHTCDGCLRLMFCDGYRWLSSNFPGFCLGEYRRRDDRNSWSEGRVRSIEYAWLQKKVPLCWRTRPRYHSIKVKTQEIRALITALTGKAVLVKLCHCETDE